MPEEPKPFLTTKQQITKLRKAGLVVKKPHIAEMILANHSYYSFVNGYRDWFTNGEKPRKFIPGTTFDDLLALYDFDSKLRRVLFPTILYIEDKLKCHVIYEFGIALATRLGCFAFKDEYLLPESYDQSSQELDKLIANLRGINENAIKHQEEAFVYAKNKYGYIPLWVMSTNMTFGQVSRFYMCQTPAIKKAISDRSHLSARDYQTVLKIISLLRNRCAHNGRVFCFAPKDRLSDQFLSREGAFTIKNDVSQRLSSVIICLRALLSKKDYRRVANELGAALCDLASQLNEKRLKSILRTMGFSRGFLKWAGIKLTISPRNNAK